MKIIVENSTWNNLGDGFYQNTLFNLISEIFPNAEVYCGEGPVERSFKPKKRHIINSFKLIENQNADIHVFSGPMLKNLIKTDYYKAIKNIIESGANYALLSCSCDGLKGLELNRVREFLIKFPPIAFASRDPYTYEVFKDFVPTSYNGICTAFLVDKYLKIDTLELKEKYFVSSFYTKPEPNYSSELNQNINIKDVDVSYGKCYLPLLPWKINRHLEIYKNSISNLGELRIIRTVQGVSNKSNNYNFKYPNSFITYNPITLLSLFKGCEFTISDRVHACAVTLVFGKPARFLHKTDRAGIFDRFNLDYKNNDGFMYPNGLNEQIDHETELLKEYIYERFSNI